MKLYRKIFDEWLFFAAFGGFVFTSILLKRIPHYSKSDFLVIYTLFIFLVITKGLEKTGLIAKVASVFKEGSHLKYKLIALTAILSMLVTNDIALITVVPLTLAMNIEGVTELVILETLTANAASALSPFGNPQNIFIYYYYHLSPQAFVKAIFPLVFFLMLFVLFLTGRLKTDGVYPERKTAFTIGKEEALYLTFFVLFILSILKVLPHYTGLIVAAYALLKDHEALKVDYFLLGTFFFFFGFTDNLMHALKISLHNSKEVFLYSAFGSQIMSNVPSALLFADFTRDWKALLWGVSVGGFGDIIGSLASVISYRLYKQKYNNSLKYLWKFHLYNIAFFTAGIALFFIL